MTDSWKASEFLKAAQIVQTWLSHYLLEQETLHFAAACSTANTELFAGCPKSLSDLSIPRPRRKNSGASKLNSLADLYAGCMIPEQLSEGREEMEGEWGNKLVIWISLGPASMCPSSSLS